MTLSKGSKATRWLEFTFEPTGEPIRFPMGTIRGLGDGPRLVVSGGMHGSEYAGVEAAIRLYHEVDPAAISGTLEVCMIYNLPAFQKNLGFVVPQDGKNPGATFPGSLTGTYGEVMAYHMTQSVLSQADAYVELHGGDIPEALTPFALAPVTGDAEVDARSRAMAIAYNLPIVVSRDTSDPAKPARSGFATAALRGTPAILVESGQQGILKMSEVETHMVGLRNILVHLGMVSGQIVNSVKRSFSSEHLATKSDLEGMWYPAIAIGDTIQEGQVAGWIRDYFGNDMAEVKAPFTGFVSVVRTSPAVSAGNVLWEQDRIVGHEE